jgi:hypothetical protein
MPSSKSVIKIRMWFIAGYQSQDQLGEDLSTVLDFHGIIADSFWQGSPYKG